ncbi:MAG TPA: helix-turn-helix transcriptional regulator [Rhizomicrobium sp.]
MNVRRLRLARKMTQLDLAFEADISGNYMSAIELGKQNFTIQILEDIAKVLGVAPLDLFAPVSAGAQMPKNLPRGKNVHHRGRRMKGKKD